MGVQVKRTTEDVLKAAYIERMTRFIEWGGTASKEMDNLVEPFVIGVYNDKYFADQLKEIYKTQKFKQKNVVIKRCSSFEDLEGIHLLYISASIDDKLEKLINKIETKPILTISQSAGFAKRGVHINLYLSEEHLRFEINEKAMKTAGFKVSHLLLGQAKIIN